MRRGFVALAAAFMLVCVPLAIAYPPATLTSTQTTVTVGDLDCGTSYQIRVRELSGGVWTNSNTYTKQTQPCATPTPTPSPTATPTPTPTPTPTQTGFPDASNTGVPAGTSLTAYTGPSTITTPGTVIDGKTLGCVDIAAANVTIRNSKVSCAGPYVIYVQDGTGASLTLEDSEVWCSNDGQGETAIGEANVTVRRANIHGCENGFDMNQNFDLRDSYLHGLGLGRGHEDDMQFATAHYENGVLKPGARDLTIVHNTLFSTRDGSFSPTDGSAFGNASVFANHSEGATNVLIQGNLLAGGSFTIYCVQNGVKGVNFRVLDNAFSTRFSPNVGFYGPATECSDETQSGNYYYETGQPLFLD